MFEAATVIMKARRDDLRTKAKPQKMAETR